MPDQSSNRPRATSVLLVEDNPGDADLMRIALTEHDATEFRVHHVTRLAAAVAHLSQHGADVVLLDLGLPDAHGLDGIEPLKRVCGDAPIVVLTGLADGKTGVAALQKGAQDYVIKGWVDGGAVVARVRAAIERRRMKSELASTANEMTHTLERLKKLSGEPNKRGG